MNNDKIPSPYFKVFEKQEELIEDLEVLKNKYGINQVFFLYSVPTDTKCFEEWYTTANVISEGMIVALTNTFKEIKNKLDPERE